MTAFRTFVIAPPLRGAGVYPLGATHRPRRRARHPRIHFPHADLRVRVHGLRSAHRGLPALLRGSAHDLRGVPGQAEEGLPPGRHRVQGLGVLRDRQPREGVLRHRVHEGLGRRVVVVRCHVLGLRGRLHLQEGRRWLLLEGLERQGIDDREQEGKLVVVAGADAEAQIGVFGGSGFYSLLDDAETVEVDTPYGEPSAPPVVGSIWPYRAAFIPRHGVKHQFPPHAINYRANLWAMKELGVQRIVGPCAAGSLQTGVKIGDFVVCDQIVDRTRSRPHTFYDGPVTTHISFADPYCTTMRPVIVDRARELGIGVHDGGTMVVIEGPRFSTRAESARFNSEGWQTINMTGYPECLLARELEICYANVSLITDYDVGVPGAPPVTHEEGVRGFGGNTGRLRELLFDVIPALPAERDCECATALADARFEVE